MNPSFSVQSIFTSEGKKNQVVAYGPIAIKAYSVHARGFRPNYIHYLKSVTVKHEKVEVRISSNHRNGQSHGAGKSGTKDCLCARGSSASEGGGCLCR